MMGTIGLTGGLVMILGQLSREQLSIQKKVETEIVISELHQKIVRSLNDKQSCINTVGVGTILSPGFTRSINSVKNAKGQNIVVKAGSGSGTSYGNGLIRIPTLELIDIAVNGNTAVLNLQITFEKMSRTIKGHNRVTKKFPLAVQISANNQALHCTSHIDASLSTAKRELCEEVGRSFDYDNQTCSLSIANQQCPQGEFMMGFDDDMNLACAPAPGSAPFEAGKNCYLLTTYNNGTYLSGISGSPWFSVVGSSPIPPTLIWQLGLRDNGGYSTNFIAGQKATCIGDGYTDQFRTISQKLNIYRQNLVFHYCCR